MALLTLNILIALSITLPSLTHATPRSDEALCEEVAFALNESVQYGTLTQREADQITDRCYELYSIY